MSALEALLLGLAQGLTEFLPVSSSGHLVILQSLMGVEQQGLLFEVVVHVATLASVLIVYRARVAGLVAGALRGEADAWRYGAKLVVATLPTVFVVLLAGPFFDAQFDDPELAGWFLLVTGLILWTTRRTMPAAHGGEPSWPAVLAIGCAQVLAIFPGVSRSGTTVAAALAVGVAPIAAAEFSFLMSILAITGAAVRTAPELAGVTPHAVIPLWVGGAVALASGVLAIRLFLHLLRTRHFHRFAYYTWTVGALFLAWLALRG